MLEIQQIAALQRFGRSLAEERSFFRDVLSFEEVAVSSPALERDTQQRSVAFRAGACVVVCTEPLSPDSLAAHYLERHPEGIGAVVFDVDDIGRTFQAIGSRGGTPIGGIERDTSLPGGLASFAVATPLDNVRFHFVERANHASYPAPMAGFIALDEPSGLRGATSRFGFRSYDHLTFNFETMAPAAMWLERVLGFKPFWKTQFHTGDVRSRPVGSGVRSVVMWDERSGIKFALNEPMPPNFQASQIYRYCEDQRGSGIQHAALAVDDLLGAVARLRAQGVRFMTTPPAYYQNLPDRLARLGLGSIPESLSALQELEILVDGEREVGYLLQIFMEPVQHGDASPFFFELIQRKGDRRFGEGNFRALFESIENAQAPQLSSAEGR
jgi:4-hydroxyphenylpyruvate dioxygenase